MKKKIAVLAVATALSAAALGTVAGAEESKGLIGVAMPTQDLQRWNQDGENMKAELEAKGYEVDLQFAGNDSAQQASQIENMIANGDQLLVVASINARARSPMAVSSASQSGDPKNSLKI